MTDTYNLREIEEACRRNRLDLVLDVVPNEHFAKWHDEESACAVTVREARALVAAARALKRLCAMTEDFDEDMLADAWDKAQDADARFTDEESWSAADLDRMSEERNNGPRETDA